MPLCKDREVCGAQIAYPRTLESSMQYPLLDLQTQGTVLREHCVPYPKEISPYPMETSSRLLPCAGYSAIHVAWLYQHRLGLDCLNSSLFNIIIYFHRVMLFLTGFCIYPPHLSSPSQGPRQLFFCFYVVALQISS